MSKTKQKPKLKVPVPQISTEDLDNISKILSEDQVAIYLRKQRTMKFSVGDILVKRYEDGRLERWSDSNPQPKRYMYVHEDPTTGIGFVKLIKISDNTLSKVIVSTTYLTEGAIYQVDPVVIESTILGDGTIDLLQLNKDADQRKKEIIAHNKSLFLHTQTSAEVDSALETLKAGDTFFTDCDPNTRYLGNCISKYKVISREPYRVAKLDPSIVEDNVNEQLRSTIEWVHSFYKLVTSLQSRGYSLPNKVVWNSDFIRWGGLYLSKPRNIMETE